jgi:hypothetical protein
MAGDGISTRDDADVCLAGKKSPLTPFRVYLCCSAAYFSVAKARGWGIVRVPMGEAVRRSAEVGCICELEDGSMLNWMFSGLSSKGL